MGSGASKNPKLVDNQKDNHSYDPNTDEEDEEDYIPQEQPKIQHAVNTENKHVRLATPLKFQTKLVTDSSFMIPKTNNSEAVQKTNLSKQSDVFEAAGRGDLDGLTALLLSNPAFLWATTTMDLNYYRYWKTISFLMNF